MNAVIRLVDAVLDVLMRPRIRRVLRWSFVVTLPLFAFLVSVRGADALLVIVLLEFTGFLIVLTLAAKLGGERGELILDFIMHPSVRRVLRSEIVIVAALPIAAFRAIRGRPPGEHSYTRGVQELPFALAMMPALAAEAAAVHLLLPDDLFVLKLVLLLLSAYGALWIVGWAAGLHMYPHRVAGGTLRARLGQLYSADVPLDAIAGVRVASERSGPRTGLVVEGDHAAFAVNGRTDVHVELHRPVAVRRPFGEPLPVRSLSLAADDPAALVRHLETGLPAPAPTQRHGGSPSCEALASS